MINAIRKAYSCVDWVIHNLVCDTLESMLTLAVGVALGITLMTIMPIRLEATEAFIDTLLVAIIVTTFRGYYRYGSSHFYATFRSSPYLIAAVLGRRTIVVSCVSWILVTGFLTAPLVGILDLTCGAVFFAAIATALFMTWKKAEESWREHYDHDEDF